MTDGGVARLDLTDATRPGRDDDRARPRLLGCDGAQRVPAPTWPARRQPCRAQAPGSGSGITDGRTGTPWTALPRDVRSLPPVEGIGDQREKRRGPARGPLAAGRWIPMTHASCERHAHPGRGLSDEPRGTSGQECREEPGTRSSTSRDRLMRSSRRGVGDLSGAFAAVGSRAVRRGGSQRRRWVVPGTVGALRTRRRTGRPPGSRGPDGC